MSSRDTILAAVRANLPKPRDLPDVPRFESDRPASLTTAFCEALQRMGGRVLEAGLSSDPLAFVRAELQNSRLVCSATPEIEGARDLSTDVDPRTLADVDHAVVRASFGVAETGSVLLADQDLRVNALAYLAQHLIVLLDPAAIVLNLHAAYGRPELREHNYTVFHSGPSATADIEGVLVQGAQGVRSLSVVLVAKSGTQTKERPISPGS